MVGTKVQKPNSGRLKSKPTNSIFKGTLSPMRPPGKSLIGTKNEYTQYQTMQTPLALRARNPDKAQNTNRMIQSPRLSNMLYHSTGPMGSQSHSNYLNTGKQGSKRKTLFQNLNEQKPVKSAQKPVPQTMFAKKAQTGISLSTYSQSTMIDSRARNNLAILTQQTQQPKKIKKLPKFKKSKSPQTCHQISERSPRSPLGPMINGS